MEIGKKLKNLRKRQNLTLQELAERSELSKGFLSQLERDLTTPSLNTFLDLLEALGTTAEDFFSQRAEEQRVFHPQDFFESENEELGYQIQYIVPNAQKNVMEPTLWSLSPGGSTRVVPPFEGESFALVLKGRPTVRLGEEETHLKKGDTVVSFGDVEQVFFNHTSQRAEILWVLSPPNF
ncbi:MAG: XRE family transcriptional regulator [Tissierellia bacterium]|nr:XRE family transcriptional regulator [Tissierellia bacterium]